MPNKTAKRGVVAAAVTVTAVAVLGTVTWHNAPTFATHLIEVAHYAGMSLLLSLGMIVCVAGAWAWFAKASRLRDAQREIAYASSYRRKASGEAKDDGQTETAIRTAKRLGWAAVLALVVVLLTAVWYWVHLDYSVARQYATSVHVTAQAPPTYQLRATEPQAAGIVKRGMGNIRGKASDVTYVDGHWTAIVSNLNGFQGTKAVISWSSPLEGTGTFTTCTFGRGASRQLGGHFTHSLERAIRHRAKGSLIDPADAYGACVGGKAELIVPLTSLVGFAAPHEVPLGDAVMYADGTIKVLRHVAPEQLPGPVYPLHLAAEQERANRAASSFGDYWFNRVGYDHSDEVTNSNGTSSDAADPNSGNVSEFTLSGLDGHVYYVTPLTPHGTSSSIVAESTVQADFVDDGHLNPVEIHTYAKPRLANAQVENNIRGNFADLPWASGLKIFEITPVTPDRWVATLGLSLEARNRVDILANGDMCLYLADDTTLVRCVSAATGQVTKEGPADTSASQPTDQNGQQPVVEPPTGSAPLSKLTNSQLLRLQQEVTNELARRLAVSPSPAPAPH